MRLKLPFLTDAQHGEIIVGRFLEDCLHGVSRFDNHQPRAPACRFRKFLDQNVLGFLLYTWLRTARANHV
jgi:hypothetical protein